MNYNIKPKNGYVILEVDKIVDDQTESGIYKDISFDRHGKTTIHAKVVAVPETGSNTVIHEIHEGFPRYSKHAQSGKDRKYVTNKSLPVTIKVGDIAYFHYLTVEDPNNCVGRSNGKFLYKVDLNDIFCSVRDGDIIMHNGYVLGNRYYGEGWKEVEVDGKMVAVQETESGIVASVQNEPLINHIEIVSIGRYPIGDEDRSKEVKSGHIVVTRDDCEFVNTIEGTDYYVFQHRDIWGILKGESVIPVANTVMIRHSEKMHEGKIFVDPAYLKTPQEGIVVSRGANASDLYTEGLQVGVHLNAANHRLIGDDLILLSDFDIHGVYVDALSLMEG